MQLLRASDIEVKRIIDMDEGLGEGKVLTFSRITQFVITLKHSPYLADLADVAVNNFVE